MNFLKESINSREAISEAAREAQRAYYREWRKKNPDKVREMNRRYWERKAAAAGGRYDEAERVKS